MPDTPASPVHPLVVVRFEGFERTREHCAGASARCKYWSVALASALLAFLLERQAPGLVLWALAPVTLLGLLDAGFVAAGRRQQAVAREFVDRLRSTPGKDGLEWAASLGGRGSEAGFGALLAVLRALTSLSVWPFYVALLASTVILGARLSKGDGRTPGSIRPPSSAFPQPGASRSLPPGMPPASRPQQTAPPFRSQPPPPTSQGPSLPVRPPLPATGRPAPSPAPPGPVPSAATPPVTPPPAPPVSLTPSAPPSGPVSAPSPPAAEEPAK